MLTETFKVQGSGEFPIDMLRYDACYPADESDARTMLEGFGSGMHTVYLRKRYAKKNEQQLTPDRWRSFGWRLITQRDDRNDPLLMVRKS